MKYTMSKGWYVLGLTACEMKDHSTREKQYLQYLGFTFQESKVQSAMVKSDAIESVDSVSSSSARIRVSMR